jgi:hypothetical protein
LAVKNVAMLAKMRLYGQPDCRAGRQELGIAPVLDRHAALQYYPRFTTSVVCLIWPPIRRTIHADAHRSNPRHKPGREHPNNFLPKIAKD